MRVMRGLYTAATYVMAPFVLYRLAARGLRNRGYFARWRERFGLFDAPDRNRSIWVHAVSVGEVNAAIPLIDALMERYPDRRMVVTTITPTGSDRVLQVFADRVFHVYLPYDLPAGIRRFLDRIRPELAVVMETEIWPNLFLACHRRGIPIIVANGRLSERSLRGYGPVRSLARLAIRCATYVAAQSPHDVERFLRLGAVPERTTVVGNLKFDMPVPQGLLLRCQQVRERWGPRRPVWIAASTHEGEEAPVLQAHAKILSRFPDALLLLAPRHPERFRPALSLCRNYGFRTSSRSEDEYPGLDSQVFVVDTMGELVDFYATCDVAFVGGSLDPIGGHNVLEAAALGKPVLVGPHTFNFAEITEDLLLARAAWQIEDGNALGTATLNLLSDAALREEIGAAAMALVARDRGAVDRIMKLCEAMVRGELKPPAVPGS